MEQKLITFYKGLQEGSAGARTGESLLGLDQHAHVHRKNTCCLLMPRTVLVIATLPLHVANAT